MVRGDAKIDLRDMVATHRRSFRASGSGRLRWSELVLFDVIPFAAAAICIWRSVYLPSATSIGLLTTTGLLSAFLFGLMIQVSDRAATWASENPPPGEDTSWHAQYLEQLSANAGYASLVSVLAAVLFVIASTTTHWPLRVVSAIAIGLGIHLVLTLLMVIRRLFALTQERLRRARTGAGGRRAA